MLLAVVCSVLVLAGVALFALASLSHDDHTIEAKKPALGVAVTVKKPPKLKKKNNPN
jgi:hypothetical protein